jgi:hypothetical protein
VTRKVVAPAFAEIIEPSLPREWPSHGLGPAAVLLEMLPAPSTFSPGAWVGVTEGDRAGAGIGRLFRRRAWAHVAVRCTALLAKGYERVGAGVDSEGRSVAWGRAPASR